MYILSERADDPGVAFARYREYLKANEYHFPPGAYALATSDWYFDFRQHKCPHDAWLEWAKFEEPSEGDRHERRTVSLSINLLGAYHDGTIELRYPRVFEYRLSSAALDGGHRDWRYDEFRLDERGRLVHEIEWCGHKDTGSWLIVASDIEYTWSPFK